MKNNKNYTYFTIAKMKRFK